MQILDIWGRVLRGHTECAKECLGEGNCTAAKCGIDRKKGWEGPCINHRWSVPVSKQTLWVMATACPVFWSHPLPVECNLTLFIMHVCCKGSSCWQDWHEWNLGPATKVRWCEWCRHPCPVVLKIWSKRESQFELLGWGLGTHTHVCVLWARNGSVCKSGRAELRVIGTQQCMIIESDRKDH